MSDLAQRISAAREASGLTLQDAEQATKIRRRFLEAIEAGDWGQLPDGLPARGFVKLYARWLGMDEDSAVTDFDADTGHITDFPYEPVPEPPSRQPMPSKFTRPPVKPAKSNLQWKGALPPPDDPESLDAEFKRTRRSLAELDDELETDAAALPAPTNGKPANGPSRTTFTLNPTPVIDNVNFAKTNVAAATTTRTMGSARSAAPMPARTAGNARAIWLIVGVAVVALVGALAAVALLPALRGGTPARPAPTVVVVQTPLPQTAVVGQPATPSAAVANATPNSANRGPGVFPALPGGGVRLALDALERAWVRVKVDGNVVFEGIPSPGQTAPWTGSQSIAVETGNAGAFEAVVNGARLGRLGERNATLRRAWEASGATKDE